MKCAMDLCATAAVVAAENAAAEEARRQQEIKDKHDRTIAFCERIGAELEKLASKGEKPEYTFPIDWHGRELKSTRSDYADKRLSYKSASKPMDISVMIEWFKPYCFAVTTAKFNYYSYNLGLNIGYQVTVKPDPDCFKK